MGIETCNQIVLSIKRCRINAKTNSTHKFEHIASRKAKMKGIGCDVQFIIDVDKGDINDEEQGNNSLDMAIGKYPFSNNNYLCKLPCL